MNFNNYLSNMKNNFLKIYFLFNFKVLNKNAIIRPFNLIPFNGIIKTSRIIRRLFVYAEKTHELAFISLRGFFFLLFSV